MINKEPAGPALNASYGLQYKDHTCYDINGSLLDSLAYKYSDLFPINYRFVNCQYPKASKNTGPLSRFVRTELFNFSSYAGGY
jgi:hypothetical protein